MAGKGGGKCKKADRNKLFCKGYRDRNQREKNKLKDLRKHLQRFPDDKVAQAASLACQKAIKGFQASTDTA